MRLKTQADDLSSEKNRIKLSRINFVISLKADSRFSNYFQASAKNTSDAILQPFCYC